MATPPQMKATLIRSVALPRTEEEPEGNGWMQPPNSPLLQLYCRTIEEEMCRLMILLHLMRTMCCILQNQTQICSSCGFMSACCASAHVLWSVWVVLLYLPRSRLTSVIQKANLTKSVSPSVPTRADWFVSTNFRACFTAILVCISVSAISVALFLHASAYFYTGYVIIHASEVWRVWGIILMSSFYIVYHILLAQRRAELWI